MKKSNKTRILASFLFSMFFLTVFIQLDLNSNWNTDNSKDQKPQDDSKIDKLKTNAVITSLIRINGSATGPGAHNWTWAKDEMGYVSQGTGDISDPYIIENLEIDGQNSHGGIEIVDSREEAAIAIYFRIENNIIYNIGSSNSEKAGIKLYKTQYGTIRNNIISSDEGGNYGIHVVGYMQWGWPFHPDTSKFINITGNTITNTMRGIYIEEGSEQITVSENIIKYTSYSGITISHRCVRLTIMDNIITENYGFGIKDADSNTHNMPEMEPMYTDGNLIKNNIIYKNSIGLYLSKTMGATVSYNNISSNYMENGDGKGIHLKGASWNYIVNNTISDNLDIGVKLEDGLTHCFKNRIYGNKISGNGQNAVELTSPPPFWVMGGWENNWSWWKTGMPWVYPIIGNEWDNYTGADADDDGVGDIPHVFQGNEDPFPKWNDGIEGHTIFINDSLMWPGSPYNWTGWASKKFWCTKGSGMWNDPYVISPNEFWDGKIDAWGNDFGISIVDSDINYFRIEGLTITNSSLAGMKLYHVIMEPEIENNNISFNNGHGLYLEAVKGVSITENIIRNNTNTGIYITNHSGGFNFNEKNHIIENTISGNGIDGIYIEKDSDYTNITDNTIENNSRYGVNINETTGGLMGGCNGTTVYNNHFEGNGINGNDNGTLTRWYLVPPEVIYGRGNFWADYDGADGDDDGIGDTGDDPYPLKPYKIAGSSLSEDRYPIWDDGLEENALYIDAYASGVNAHNWTWASRRLFVSGTGNSWDPFIIQNVRFNGSDNTSPITIKNSNMMTTYFKIINCTLYDIGGTAGGSAGIYLYNTDYGELINNTFSTNNDGNYGIFLDGGMFRCDKINITGNLVENEYSTNPFKYGIYLDKSGDHVSSYNIIDGNIIRNNDIGIFLNNDSRFNNITNNEITNNTNIGIYINDTSADTKVYYNDIIGNGNGIIIENGAMTNQIIDNYIKDNIDFGLYINSSGNIIYYNNFIDNGINAQDDSRSGFFNTWYKEFWPKGRGNYWSNYTVADYSVDVKDEGDDGIGDIWYNITGSNKAVDKFPIFDDGHNGSRVVIDGSKMAMERGSWGWAASRTWCTGSGSVDDPYVISGLKINAQLNGSGIYIYNSNEWDDPYFIIRDCIIYNSSDTESPEPAGGIHLWKVNNATIINNTIYNNDGHGIILRSGYIEMEETKNIIIRDNFIENNNGTGIYLNGSYVHETLIDNNTIRSSGINGISIFDNAHDTTVINNTLYDNTEIGIAITDFQPPWPEGHWDDYLQKWVLDPWDFNDIINNTITKGDTGIGLESSKLVKIIGNYITQTESNAIATKDFESTNLTIIDNTIYNNDLYGINIGWDAPSFTANNYILNNNISKNGEAGILIQQCFNSIFSNNTFDENDVGIGLTYSSSFNKFIKNNIFNSIKIGFTIDDDECERNIIYDNNFTGNLINAEDLGSFTQWCLDTASLKLGNYWDDYTGTDKDDDYIGDIYYNITGYFVDSIDEYPIFWDAPVIEVVDDKPKQGQQYEKESPDFHIHIKEGFGDSFWYDVNGTLSKVMANPPEFIEGKIESLIWETFGNGTITITFYVNDIRNEVDPISVVITKLIMSEDENGGTGKTIPATDDDDDSKDEDKEEEGLPWWLQAIFTGIISASAGLVIKMSYSAHKRKKELYRKVSDSFDRIDNLETFLQDKLGAEEWAKLKGPIQQYQNHEISSKKLIKESKKSVGKRFVELFIKPKPKKRK